MKRLLSLVLGLFCIGLSMSWLARDARAQADGGWVTLFDGKSLDAWEQIGTANWKIADGVVVADQGEGFLVSKETFADYQIRVEFWVDSEANSGVFLRCEDPKKVTAKNAYEVNIFDKRPDPSYGTGAIVDVAKVVPMPKAGGQWNTYDITAKGGQLIVILNGTKTVDVQDGQHKSGRIALQYGAGAVKDVWGVVKFRKVQIKKL